MTPLVHRISEDSRHAVIKNNYAGDAGFFKAAVDVYMHQLIAKTALEGRPQLQCWAGSAGAVIYDEGTVSSCEILEGVDNLRDYDWDFSKSLVLARRWTPGAKLSPTAASALTKAIATTRRFPSIPST